jgi:hypothetical protein
MVDNVVVQYLYIFSKGQLAFIFGFWIHNTQNGHTQHIAKSYRLVEIVIARPMSLPINPGILSVRGERGYFTMYQKS